MPLSLSNPYQVATTGRAALLVSQADLDKLDALTTQAQLWRPTQGYSEVKPFQVFLKFLYYVLPTDPPTPWTEASAKGGPGSGFHDHAGRPGERGGSAPSGEQASITDTFDVTAANLRYDNHTVIVNGQALLIGSGMRYYPKGGGEAVDVEGRIVAGTPDWLMQRARDVPEVMSAIDQAFADLQTEIGGSFADIVPTEDQDRVAALMHGYKSPLTYKDRLDMLNAMTRAYLDQSAVTVRHDTSRAAVIERDIAAVAALMAEAGDETSKRLFADIAARQPDDLLRAKLSALRMGNMVRTLMDQEAVNQFASEVQRTQADLRQRYGDTVTLYRGVQGDYAKAIKQGLKKAGASTVAPVYPAASWSADEGVAHEFAGKKGVVIRQEVPVERILFSYHTTPYIRMADWPFGGKQEYEMIVANPEPTLKIRKGDLL